MKSCVPCEIRVTPGLEWTTELMLQCDAWEASRSSIFAVCPLPATIGFSYLERRDSAGLDLVGAQREMHRNRKCDDHNAICGNCTHCRNLVECLLGNMGQTSTRRGLSHEDQASPVLADISYRHSRQGGVFAMTSLGL